MGYTIPLQTTKRTCYWTRWTEVNTNYQAAIQSSAQKKQSIIDKVKLLGALYSNYQAY
jgi:hypothetical protein